MPAHPPRLSVGLLLGLALPWAALPASSRWAQGDAGGRGRAPAPVDNASHVHDDDPAVVGAFGHAAQAESEGRFAEAAELLQGIVERRFVDADGREAAPQVVAVDGRSTYEGAWLVARQRLAGGSEPLRRAYAARYEAPARELLRRAAAALDESLLTEVARRFLPLAEGRAAALLLADLALERGDAQAAYARLEALEDLEELGREDAQTLAGWRTARLTREARLLARTPADVPAVLAHLERAALEGPRAALLDERVPPALRRPRAPVLTWPTTGGADDRTALPPAASSALRPGPSLALDADAEERALRREYDPLPPNRPSPWVGPRVVVGREVLFAFDGEVLQALRRSDGVLLDRVSLREERSARPTLGRDPREELPLLEGHALTLDESPGHAPRLFVASALRTDAARRREYREAPSAPEPPQGEIVMLRWDGARLLRGWRAGSLGSAHGLPPGLALFGAPCLHHGLAWVAGTRLTEATSDQLECWLVGLDPATGRPVRQVRLGSGGPVRLKRLDEAIPSSPAAAHGRVVVSTSLGWIAAVDAEDGRIAWIYRYDRGLELGRIARLGTREADDTPRLTGFANEPPLIAFGLTLVAPTDSDLVLGLATRPRGPARDLVRWDPLNRRVSFPDMAVEALVGAVGGDGTLPPTIIVTGKGDAEEGGPPGRVIAGLEPRLGQTRWSVEAGTGRAPATFGRAALTPNAAYVPTLHGILVVDLAQGRATDLLGRGHLPPHEAEPESRWYGSLVPLPGEGLIAVNESHLTFWRERK